MYITLEDYRSIYGPIDERLFGQLALDACRVMDIHTTGADNVKKLKMFFPTDADDAQYVKTCAAKIVNLLYRINEAEIAAIESRGTVATENGPRGRIVTRIEAGNEAITYSEAKVTTTAIDQAVADRTARDKMIGDIIWQHLAGVRDCNGIGLLYMGPYPRRYLC